MSTTNTALKNKTNADAEPLTAKKARTLDTNPATLTPYQQKMEAIKAETKKQQDCPIIVIEEMPLGEDYDDVSDDEKTKMEAALSNADVDRYRVILTPQARDDAFEEMEKLILGKQYGHCLMMFDTSYSYALLGAFEAFKAQYQACKDPKLKLNMILGFTYNLYMYDVWMNDFEIGWNTVYGGGKMVSGLAGMWKYLLRTYSADDLGLDEAFSYPGVKAFLKLFKKTVEAIDMYDEPSLKFKYY